MPDDSSVSSISSSKPADIAPNKANNLKANPQEGDIVVDETTFSDENFRNFVLQNYCQSGSNILTPDTINATEIMDCSSEGISNLKGIEYFTALTDLRCDHNQLTSLDVSGCTALIYLDCRYNHLTNLDTNNLTKSSNFNSSGQTSQDTCYINIFQKRKVVHMSSIIGPNGDLSKITILDDSRNWKYDSETGIATYNGEGNPSNLIYNYATDTNGHSLSVSVALSSVIVD